MSYHAIGNLNLNVAPRTPALLQRTGTLTFARPHEATAVTRVRTEKEKAPPSPLPVEEQTTQREERLATEMEQESRDASVPFEQPTEEYYDPFSPPMTTPTTPDEPSGTETLLPETKKEIPWKWIGIGIAVLAGGAFLITRN